MHCCGFCLVMFEKSEIFEQNIVNYHYLIYSQIFLLINTFCFMMIANGANLFEINAVMTFEYSKNQTKSTLNNNKK